MPSHLDNRCETGAGALDRSPATCVRVRWHAYDEAPSRVEWLELPQELEHAGIYRFSAWIDSYLRNREGLPADSGRPGERVLWWDWDYIRSRARIF